MIYAPLWQDVYFETSAYTVLNYSVRTSSETGVTDNIIYKGKAYSQPNLGMISIKLNPICEKYMGNSLPEGWFPNGSGNYNPAGLTMSFYLFNDDTETVLESYNFRYTYDEEFQWHNIPYSEIDNYIPGYTDYVTEQYYYEHWPNGQILGLDVNPQDSDNRRITGNVAENQWQFRTFENSTTDIHYFSNYILPWDMANTCKGDYAVYYLGRCGCWNDFLFEGNCKRTDDIVHYDYGTDGYNRLTGNPELSATIKRYCNELTTKIECNTGWLNDKQSQYFAQDLMPSIQLMIHDLKNNKVYPAVIEDTSVETKKFRNNKEMNQYTVTFRIARDYYIR